jgi:hypothetical protein
MARKAKQTPQAAPESEAVSDPSTGSGEDQAENTESPTEFEDAFKEFAEKRDIEQGRLDEPEDEPPAEQPAGDPPSEEEKQQEPPPDMWAGASEAQRAAYQTLVNEAASLRARAMSDSGRVSALQRQLDSKPAVPQGAAAERKEGGDASGRAELVNEKLKQLREEYPDLAEPIVEAFATQEARLKAIQESLDGVTQTVGAAQAERAVEQQIGALQARHPDWKQKTASPAFANWANAQPDFIKQVIVRNGQQIVDAGEASALLEQFMRDTGQFGVPKAPVVNPAQDELNARRKRQIDAAAALPNRSGPAGSGPPDDFDGAFAFYAAQKARQQRA